VTGFDFLLQFSFFVSLFLFFAYPGRGGVCAPLGWGKF